MPFAFSADAGGPAPVLPVAAAVCRSPMLATGIPDPRLSPPPLAMVRGRFGLYRVPDDDMTPTGYFPGPALRRGHWAVVEAVGPLTFTGDSPALARLLADRAAADTDGRPVALLRLDAVADDGWPVGRWLLATATTADSKDGPLPCLMRSGLSDFGRRFLLPGRGDVVTVGGWVSATFRSRQDAADFARAAGTVA
jgi:hypothetical protein